MKKKTKDELIEPTGRILTETLSDVLKERFSRYAKYVLQERAIPDVRDGLKPVQRRILYTMFLEGNVHSKQTRKCARTVGQVIGRFHPHGDTSVYDAMVRLSQDWKMRMPLLEFQGNNGSIDNDPAAAYRYTESRLAEISDYLVADINKNTVEMQYNFDDTELEPLVLPARYPNLLVNGAYGLAVGASTNIPPHNLVEVCDAVIYRLCHKRCQVVDLLEFIKGPDFPTGGIIDDVAAIRQMYETGQGSFYVTCKTHIEENKNFNSIIIDEVPYNVSKAGLWAYIDKKRRDDSIDNIIETSDKSGKNGFGIVIDIKKECDPNIIIQYLLQKNLIKEKFTANLLAIDNNHPRTMNLLQIIDSYIAHQIDIITRRSYFDLEKNQARVHIVDGLIKVLSILDEVIKTIRASKDKADAKNNLVTIYGFTELQAEAIVTLQLYRLTHTDVTVLMKEKEDLEANISYLTELLNSETKMENLIAADLKKISKQFGTPRKTLILDEKIKTTTIDKRDLISKDETVVVITRDGYIKRSSLKSYGSTSDLPGVKLGDSVVGIFKTTTIETLLAFTNLGNYIYLPVHEITDGKWKEEGKHLNSNVSLSSQEKIVSAFIVSDFNIPTFILMVTKNGQIKRTQLVEFIATRYTKPIRAFRLMTDDELIEAQPTTRNSDIIIFNSQGIVSFFNETEVPAVSLKAGGVKAMNQGKNPSPIVGALIYKASETSKILLVSDKGAGRVIDSRGFVKTSRLGAKQSAIKIFKNSPQNIVYVSKYHPLKDEPNMLTVVTTLGPVSVNIDELKPMPLESYFKENLNLEGTVLNVYNLGGLYLDASFELDPEPVSEVKQATNNEEDVCQPSLFDLYDLY